LVNYYSFSQQDRLSAREWEREVVKSRLELVDRLARIVGRSHLISNLTKKHPSSIEIEQKVAEFYSDYSSIVIAAKIYFGPKTIAAVNKLAGTRESWVEKNIEDVKALLTAMNEELTVGLKMHSMISLKN
jgi:hypothetical protein